MVCKWGRMRLSMLELTGLAVADSARDTAGQVPKGISCWDPFNNPGHILRNLLESGHWANSGTHVLTRWVSQDPTCHHTLPS